MKFYTVSVSNQSFTKTFDHLDEALEHASRHVYLTHEEGKRVREDLKKKACAFWNYGLKDVETTHPFCIAMQQAFKRAVEDRAKRAPAKYGIELIKSLMEKNGLTTHQLTEIGDSNQVVAVLSRKRLLSKQQALKLSKRFKLDCRSFLRK